MILVNHRGYFEFVVFFRKEPFNKLNQKIVYDILWSDPVQDTSDTENKSNENREYLANGTVIRFGTERIHSFLSENHL